MTPTKDSDDGSSRGTTVTASSLEGYDGTDERIRLIQGITNYETPDVERVSAVRALNRELGKLYSDAKITRQDEHFLNALADAVITQGAGDGAKSQRLESRILDLEDKLGDITRREGHCYDQILDDQSRIAELKELAAIDEMTGLPRKRVFQETLEKAIKRSQRTGDSFAVFMGDVDFFKRFNDTYGHPAGDEALIYVADQLQESLRGDDMVSRYGGEEFVGIIYNGDKKIVKSTLDRLRSNIEQGTIGSEERKVTISIGAAVFDPVNKRIYDPAKKKSITTSPERLKELHGDVVELADTSLYTAKERGRNRVEVISPRGRRK
jgi:diguanylate cyclase (GGDEF)-like protein